MNSFEEALANSVNITNIYEDRRALVQYLLTDEPPPGYKLIYAGDPKRRAIVPDNG